MIAIVSGGSRGLGAEISEHLLGQGHSVASFARSATDVTRRLATAHGERYEFEEVDITDRSAVDAFVRGVEERMGVPDALVNNAAVGQDSLLAHTSPDRIAEIIRINLEAPILLTRRVVRGMLREGKPGQVLNIGSIGAQQGYAGLTVYAATKGGLESFTRALARELAGRITVNTVAPGFFDSEMSGVLLPEQRDAIVRRTPTGELTSTEQLLTVIDLVLAGRSNLNGAVIQVDGGATA